MQEELLRRAYKRSVHRSYIEAALRRTGHSVLTKESENTSLRIRTIE
jgi:lambda repressor-like predicted transcriptional regulator